ncbi:hypothetical protein S245_029459, partial [Arachis hypogaea]
IKPHILLQIPELSSSAVSPGTFDSYERDISGSFSANNALAWALERSRIHSSSNEQET